MVEPGPAMVRRKDKGDSTENYSMFDGRTAVSVKLITDSTTVQNGSKSCGRFPRPSGNGNKRR